MDGTRLIASTPAQTSSLPKGRGTRDEVLFSSRDEVGTRLGRGTRLRFPPHRYPRWTPDAKPRLIEEACMHCGGLRRVDLRWPRQGPLFSWLVNGEWVGESKRPRCVRPAVGGLEQIRADLVALLARVDALLGGRR